MATETAVLAAAGFRQELEQRGGGSAARCFQCATCSSVCELAAEDLPFPRRQMLMAQWGLSERLVADPAVWLCHQCNDCSVRCPRDAKPGDVLQAVRSLAVERLAVPQFMGRLVAKARASWPLLIFAPILFWVVLLAGLGRFEYMGVVGPDVGFDHFVPHALIYSVYFPVAFFVMAMMSSGGMRFWRLVGNPAKRRGSFLAALLGVLWEIATHRRFASCGAARSRRWGHLFLFWGFLGAAVTSGFIIVVLYVPPFQQPLPLPLTHWIKLLGNLSAVALVAGGVWLWWNRSRNGARSGISTAFDTFFLYLVLLVIATGCLVEAGRVAAAPELAGWLYVVHLGAVLCLFVTLPYSKFAHLVYRTLAMVHERMSAPERRVEWIRPHLSKEDLHEQSRQPSRQQGAEAAVAPR